MQLIYEDSFYTANTIKIEMDVRRCTASMVKIFRAVAIFCLLLAGFALWNVSTINGNAGRWAFTMVVLSTGFAALIEVMKRLER